MSGAGATVRELRFPVGPAPGREVSALLTEAPAARWLLVLGHGAGAGMRHPFLERMSALLAGREISSFRYQFPYMEAGGRRPDSQALLLATVRAAVQAAGEAGGGTPILAGGKSMGGRMTSLAASEAELPGVRGLVFLGFPLHAAGKPSDLRGKHLTHVDRPMLFLQGTRDALADLELIRRTCDGLGGRARLHIVEGGDHSFRVLKRSGRTEEQVLAELADAAAAWSEELDTA